MNSVRQEFLATIIVTAVEQGIYYWAKVRDYAWTDHPLRATAEIMDAEGGGVEQGLISPDLGWVKLNASFVNRALKRIREDRSIEIAPYILKEILLADRTNGDEGEMDSDAADVIVQIGLFGEIVYS